MQLALLACGDQTNLHVPKLREIMVASMAILRDDNFCIHGYSTWWQFLTDNIEEKLYECPKIESLMA